MGLGRIIGYVASGALILLGVIFLLASAYAASRVSVGTILVLLGLAIAYVAWRSGARQVSVKYEIQAPGTLKIESLKCPNCGADVDPSKIQLRVGAPWVKCTYCGQEFQVTEEPKW